LFGWKYIKSFSFTFWVVGLFRCGFYNERFFSIGFSELNKMRALRCFGG
jgi:hypothetical protein